MTEDHATISSTNLYQFEVAYSHSTENQLISDDHVFWMLELN